MGVEGGHARVLSTAVPTKKRALIPAQHTLTYQRHREGGHRLRRERRHTRLARKQPANLPVGRRRESESGSGQRAETHTGWVARQTLAASTRAGLTSNRAAPRLQAARWCRRHAPHTHIHTDTQTHTRTWCRPSSSTTLLTAMTSVPMSTATWLLVLIGGGGVGGVRWSFARQGRRCDAA